MIKKILYSLLTILLVLILIGCVSRSSSIEHNFKKGVAELQLELLDNAPPKRIFPGSNFKIILRVHNQAAYPITDGTVRVLDIAEQYFVIRPVSQDIIPSGIGQLEGRSALSPAGDTAYIEFEGKANELFLNTKEHRENFVVEVNYNSSLEFADTICINPNLYAVYDGGCRVDERKTYSGQGAPLAVTQMEEIIYPGAGAEAEFRLMLRNRGKGEVGNVTFKSAKLGNEELDCFFQGTGLNEKEINFKEKRQEVTLLCRKPFLKSTNSYTTTLAVEFDYDYTLTQKHRLTLVR